VIFNNCVGNLTRNEKAAATPHNGGKLQDVVEHAQCSPFVTRIHKRRPVAVNCAEYAQLGDTEQRKQLSRYFLSTSRRCLNRFVVADGVVSNNTIEFVLILAFATVKQRYMPG
jgi:hypothetical protein